MIKIRISDLRSLRSWYIKWTDQPFPKQVKRVPLTFRDPSEWSWITDILFMHILIQVISMKRNLWSAVLFFWGGREKNKRRTPDHRLNGTHPKCLGWTWHFKFIIVFRSLAAEWGKYGMRFNAIAPGPIETKVMTVNLVNLITNTNVSIS